jgi:hypothetical protein
MAGIGNASESGFSQARNGRQFRCAITRGVTQRGFVLNSADEATIVRCGLDAALIDQTNTKARFVTSRVALKRL